MDVSVIPIGDSKGIRFTKTLIEKLEKYNITDTVELILEKSYYTKTKTGTKKGLGKSF